MIRQPTLCYRPKPDQPKVDLFKLRYPIYGSPKVDAFRSLVDPQTTVVSRRLRPFPNRHVQRTFGFADLIGFDGELVAGDPTAPNVFIRSQTAVMSEDAVDDLTYFVFDYWASDKPYKDRLAHILFHTKRKNVVILEQTLVKTPDEALKLEEKFLKEGYEGSCWRSPGAPYKQGRSTLGEQYLLKRKPFMDSEAKILEVEEMMHNDNMATRDNTGKLKRSKSKSGMRPAGMLGRLKVVDNSPNVPHRGVPFYLGSGALFTLENRMRLWKVRKQLPGLFVTYRFQPAREGAAFFGRALRFRDAIDL